MAAVTIDSKGRLSIPKELREELELGAGDVVFVKREGDTLRLAKAVNPLASAVAEGVAEYRAGRKIALKRLAKKHGVRAAQLEDAIDDVVDLEAIEKARKEYRRGDTITLDALKRSLRKR
jgi:AbrB family looped-hinge helix DNA binding protein